MGKVAFSLLLLLAVVTLGASSDGECLLTGSWRNDLGSNMTISAVDSTGAFSGKYLTAVSATSRRILESPFVGFQHPTNETAQPTFGFTVKWTFTTLGWPFPPRPVSATSRRILESPFVGFQHPTNETAQPTFGFTVKWTFTNNTAVFVGQCFMGADGKEFLKTMWLLRAAVESPGDDWKATRVGTNLFVRNP
nr:avidin-like [Pelodiscus sinensis]|eukprot:XP_025041507.1 avidin-like [Pelodiscus sinensis]